MNKDETWKELEKQITEKIRDTYSDKVWLPIPEELRAKDAVAADLLRQMAPAMANIAREVFEAFIASELARTRTDTAREIVERIEDANFYGNGDDAVFKNHLELIKKDYNEGDEK